MRVSPAVLGAVVGLTLVIPGEPVRERLVSIAGAAAQTVERPGRWAASHFRVRDPARLSGAEAERIYTEIRAEIAGLYAISRRPELADYTRWRRHVTAPYLTTTHGNRYHNIYARSDGRSYGRYEAAGTMPAGTVIAKDSFSVTDAGQIHPGPLSLMEKLPPGASPETGDWRFTEIMPDGSVYGDSGGDQAANVAHCIACHGAVAETQDWLYFPPFAYRVPSER